MPFPDKHREDDWRDHATPHEWKAFFYVLGGMGAFCALIALAMCSTTSPRPAPEGDKQRDLGDAGAKLMDAAMQGNVALSVTLKDGRTVPMQELKSEDEGQVAELLTHGGIRVQGPQGALFTLSAGPAALQYLSTLPPVRLQALRAARTSAELVSAMEASPELSRSVRVSDTAGLEAYAVHLAAAPFAPQMEVNGAVTMGKGAAAAAQPTRHT